MIALRIEGSVNLLIPDREDDENFWSWVDEHVGPDHLGWDGGLAVEPRFTDNIIAALESDGFEVLV